MFQKPPSKNPHSEVIVKCHTNLESQESHKNDGAIEISGSRDFLSGFPGQIRHSPGKNCPTLVVNFSNVRWIQGSSFYYKLV